MSQKGEKVQKGEDFPKFKYLQCGFAFDDIFDIGEICKYIWLIHDLNSSYVSVRYEVLHCFCDGQRGCGDLKSISMHWCH